MSVLEFRKKPSKQEPYGPTGDCTGCMVGHTDDGAIVIELDAETDYIELDLDVAERFVAAIQHHIDKVRA